MMTITITNMNKRSDSVLDFENLEILLTQKIIIINVDILQNHVYSLKELIDEYISIHPNVAISSNASYDIFFRSYIDQESDINIKYLYLIYFTFNMYDHIKKEVNKCENLRWIEDHQFKEKLIQMLDSTNYTTEWNDSEQVYNLVKRDIHVDSVLPLVKPDTRIDLLTYLDFRIENNIIEKQAILKRLADSLEPDRKEYGEVNKELTSKIFHLFNNFRIRHNNDRQALFENEVEQIEYYDICFKMVLHLIREKEIQEYLNKINQKFNRE